MKGIIVEQFEDVKNQFIIRDTVNGVTYFQSYSSIIAKKEKGKVTLGKNWDYSMTTGKYRNRFLNETKKETQAKLDSGVYLYDENL